jgi:hypothetical protein
VPALIIKEHSMNAIEFLESISGRNSGALIAIDEDAGAIATGYKGALTVNFWWFSQEGNDFRANNTDCCTLESGLVDRDELEAELRRWLSDDEDDEDDEDADELDHIQQVEDGAYIEGKDFYTDLPVRGVVVGFDDSDGTYQIEVEARRVDGNWIDEQAEVFTYVHLEGYVQKFPLGSLIGGQMSHVPDFWVRGRVTAHSAENDAYLVSLARDYPREGFTYKQGMQFWICRTDEYEDQDDPCEKCGGFPYADGSTCWQCSPPKTV